MILDSIVILLDQPFRQFTCVTQSGTHLFHYHICTEGKIFGNANLRFIQKEKQVQQKSKKSHIYLISLIFLGFMESPRSPRLSDEASVEAARGPTSTSSDFIQMEEDDTSSTFTNPADTSAVVKKTFSSHFVLWILT